MSSALAKKCVQHPRVKLCAVAFTQDREAFFAWKRILVSAATAECVKDVGDGRDPSLDRYIDAGEPVPSQRSWCV